MSENSRPSAPEISCDGWWEQQHFGRQPMHGLRLRFHSGRLVGAGHDMIGEFKLRGTIAEAGKVNLVKQYVGMHAVDYVGTYDGEGLMWGQWWIGSLNNRWLIKIKRSKAAPSDATDIETIV